METLDIYLLLMTIQQLKPKPTRVGFMVLAVAIVIKIKGLLLNMSLEADLLYQLMERVNVSIRFEYPDSNPTERSFTDEYLQLIRKTDEPFKDKVEAFKRKRKEQTQ